MSDTDTALASEPSASTVRHRHALSRLAAQLCQDAQFRVWLRSQHTRLYGIAENGWAFAPEEICAVVVRKICSVQSRAEFDTDAEAAARFHELVRKPWVAAQEAPGRGA